MFHRTPTPGDNSGIPPIAPYDRNAPNYLAFRPQGPVIVQNFLGKSIDNFIIYIKKLILIIENLDSLNDVMEKASPLPAAGGGSNALASLVGTVVAVILAKLM